MANELGIGSVVAAPFAKTAGRVRVNVELLDARSGQVLWSEQYDREGVDVFDTQSDIALRVGEALKASVTLEEQARSVSGLLRRLPPTNCICARTPQARPPRSG